MKELHTSAYALQDDRERLYSLGTFVSVLAKAEQTNGAFNLFDAFCPVGFSTPLHIHYADDVAVFVLEGELAVFWGDKKMKAKAGSFFFQPRGVPHGFRVEGSTPARIIYLTVPAGFDKFVIERSKPASDFGSRLSEAHYKIEILGPLPE